MLDALRRTEQGIEADPRSQFYRDLHDSLMPFVASATMESAYVMMGDFNERWQDDYVPNTLFDGVVTFAKMMHLDNAMLAVHGGRHRQHRYWTRTEGQSFTVPRLHACIQSVTELRHGEGGCVARGGSSCV